MTFKSKFIHDLTQGKVNFGASLKGISVLRYFFSNYLKREYCPKIFEMQIIFILLLHISIKMILEVNPTSARCKRL